MGLDSVELVLKIEEHFDIEIPDDVASRIVTVGDLQQFVVDELTRLGRDSKATIVLADIAYIIVDQFGIPFERVVPEARIVKDLHID